jgi:hypothetical protein
MYDGAHFVDALINPTKNGGHYVGKHLAALQPNKPINFYNPSVFPIALRELVAMDIPNTDIKTYSGVDPFLRSIIGDVLGLQLF